jgi:formyl-CoA transferase
MGALSFIRVLDLTRVLAGPWCTQLLADLGADVIKVERPAGEDGTGGGDDTRGWGPPYLKDARGRDTSESAYYLSANRGKRSITLDISRPAGQDIVKQLVTRCDVLVENYKAGQLTKYGLDYASLSALNPKLIYCSITGFGQDGPYKDRAGYDFIIQGMAGFMSITGERDDRPGGGPQKAGVAISDLMTGLYATIAIQAALVHRLRTNKGQYIDMALFDVMLGSLANMNLNYLTTGRTPQRAGNAHQNIVPYQVFAAADGHVIVAVGNDAQYERLCEVINRLDLYLDKRFRTNAERVRNRDALIPVLADEFARRSVAWWVQKLEPVGVPCGPINTIAQAIHDPQTLARGLRFDLPHPLGGPVPMVGTPIKMSASGVGTEIPPPTLGQHTDEILKGLVGLDAAAIDLLHKRRIV